MVAASTSDSRKEAPRAASGSRPQLGFRIGTMATSATQIATPMNGNDSACSEWDRLT
jgi:hypothetical protein